jgi:hypothetical protein
MGLVSFAVLRRRVLLALVAFLLLLAPLAAQEEALRIHRDIFDLTDEAATIVHGTIVSAVVEPHPQFKNLSTVLVTMSVAESLKGPAQKSVTFRQYLWDIRSITSNGGYHKGEELLLFLRSPSTYGLTSPAGLQQGRFEITRDAKGQLQAMNVEHNAGLFINLAGKARQRRTTLPPASQKLAAQPPGPVQLSDLAQLVRAVAGGGK